MSRRQLAETPVLVVGAGATGLLMASELMRYGIESRIVDKLPVARDYSRPLKYSKRWDLRTRSSGRPSDTRPLQELATILSGRVDRTRTVALVPA